VRAFADTNLIVYAQSEGRHKTTRAIQILEAGIVISTQVINETVAVLTRKFGFDLVGAHAIANYLLDACEVVPVDAATIRQAIGLAKRYQLSHWDSLVVAAALLAGCDTFYSEDLQNGLRIDDRMTIVNPFATTP
jgi:predicted nucleic acid-binding protein